MENLKKLEAVVEQYHRNAQQKRTRNPIIISSKLNMDSRELRSYARRNRNSNILIG